MPKLSARLATILDLVRPASRLIDVGSDHAYLPIAAVSRGIASLALAIDNKLGPCQTATRHIEQAQLRGKIEVRQADGLKGVNLQRGDVIVIAGMGSEEIISILEARKKASYAGCQLILQANWDNDLLRKYLQAEKIKVDTEVLVKDKKHVYTIISILDLAQEESSKELSEVQYFLGKELLEKYQGTEDEDWLFYLNKQRKLIKNKARGSQDYLLLLAEVEKIMEARGAN